MTDPLTEWIDEMAAKCRAATPGPYQTEGGMELYVFTREGAMLAEMRGTGAGLSDEQQSANARYIAALPPETVSALLECVRALGAILAKHPDECEHIHAGWESLARLRKLAEGRRG